MRPHALVVALLLVLAASPAAHAVEPVAYPTGNAPAGTLMDANCTDLVNGMSVVAGVYTQTAGTNAPDGLCDSDQRVRTGAQNADAIFGPFTAPLYARVLEVLEEPTNVGGSGSFSICLAVTKGYEPPVGSVVGTDLIIKTCAAPVFGLTSGDEVFGSIGINAVIAGNNIARVVAGTIEVPRTFYILLDVAGGVGHTANVTATSWTGNLGLIWDN